jgi:2-polyprenyl-6-hydroxyphenyl methylase/3-demethylubiquinone-9 3-methyltransferase
MWFKAVSSREAIERAYGDHYANLEGSYYFDSPAARSFFRKLLTKIEPRTNVSAPKLLDIGCGVGTLLEEARSLGHEVEGLELCARFAELARSKGFQVRLANVMDLQESAKYDVITALDIIEHVPDPVGLLRSVYQALKSGG